MPGRRRPGRHLTHQQPHIANLIEHVAMPRRVEPVRTAGHHRDRLPAATQRSAVGGTVDAVGAAGDHDLLRVRRVVGELAGDVIAVTGRGP